MLPTLSRKAEGIRNPYKLPRGERLRRELVKVFAQQQQAILRYMKTGKKDTDTSGLGWKGGPPLSCHVGEAIRGCKNGAPDGSGADKSADSLSCGGPSLHPKDLNPPVPFAFPDFHDFGLGALDISRRMTPILTATWEAAAGAFAPRVGLDPSTWEVVNPNTARMIEEAALAFCESTNDTTSMQLDEAIRKLKDELNAGIVDVGESLELLTERVKAIFDKATTARARRIAWTETSRAVHAAQEQAAIQSGVVTGWEWLASGDACPTCVAIAARCRFVKLGQPFAVIGDDPNYATIKFPPAHPHCNCTMVEVLDTDVQPTWGGTLHDPDPATDEEHDEIARDLMDRYERIPNPAKRQGPAPARKPVPLSRKRLRIPTEAA